MLTSKHSSLFALCAAFGVLSLGCGSDSCEEVLRCNGADSGDPDGGGTGGTAGGGGSTGTGGSGGDGGGPGGTGGAEPDAPSCDTTASPADEMCLVDDAFGVFVSPLGDATTGMGTRLAPYATIGRALTEAAATGKDVYVCTDGSAFSESLSLDASHDGIRIYGSFSCATWEYDPALRSRIESPDPIAVRINGLTEGALFEGFEIFAPDAIQSGGSSIGVLVAESDNVVLSQMRIEAGNGADGLIGTSYPTRASMGAPGNPGVDACSEMVPGGAAVTTMCGGMASESVGGKGGDGGSGTGNAGSGDNGMPALAGGTAGVGQVEAALDCSQSEGDTGSPGSDGSAGGGGGSAGQLTPSGYTAANGSSGTPGSVGQGGGGGGGAKAPVPTTGCPGGPDPATGASGGSGGGGGCGGLGGGGGGGGGASIAFASVGSSVRLENVDLVAGNGGVGASGGGGQQGGRGGLGALGGAGASSSDACSGGQGGQGGNGGPGAGGGGGPSIGVGFTGTAPMIAGGSITIASVAAQGGAAGSMTAPGTAVGATGALAQQMEL